MQTTMLRPKTGIDLISAVYQVFMKEVDILCAQGDFAGQESEGYF